MHRYLLCSALSVQQVPDAALPFRITVHSRNVPTVMEDGAKVRTPVCAPYRGKWADGRSTQPVSL